MNLLIAYFLFCCCTTLVAILKRIHEVVTSKPTQIVYSRCGKTPYRSGLVNNISDSHTPSWEEHKKAISWRIFSLPYNIGQFLVGCVFAYIFVIIIILELFHFNPIHFDILLDDTARTRKEYDSVLSRGFWSLAAVVTLAQLLATLSSL